jgi:PPOX class probable F420-dependent enzyme
MSATIPESHLDLVRAPTSVVLTTVNDDGTPQSTAVWSMLDTDGSIRTSMMTSRHKYHNLVARPLATLFYMDPASPYRTLEVRADVKMVPDDADRAFTKRIIESYGVDPASMADTVAEERVILTFVPRRVVTFGS